VDDNSRALVERRVDVAFLRAPLDDPRLDGALVAEEQICVALPNGHPLSSRKKIPIRALDGADMVGMRDEFTGDFNKTMDAVLREHDVASRTRVQTGSLETMLGLVASGMGIAICSATVRFMLVSGITLRPLEPRQTLKSLWLAWRRDRENLPVIRSFRDQVGDAGLAFSVPGR
jgi:DNA-binding transcriptional LysR family regulator